MKPVQDFLGDVIVRFGITNNKPLSPCDQLGEVVQGQVAKGGSIIKSTATIPFDEHRL